MRRFDAAIFDMDGVLIDSEPLHAEVLNALLGRIGHQLVGPDYEAFIGTTSEAMFGQLIQRWSLPGTVAEYIAEYDIAILESLQQRRPPQPGVRELIDAARALGMQVAVASSSRRVWIDATLRSLELSTAFDAIISGDDISHSKPDPEIYTLAAARLGVLPSRCLAVEDSPNGVQSARHAGMSVVGVRTSYTAHLNLDRALETVNSLADLDLTRLLS